MIWLSQMFTWVIKKCLNLTFKCFWIFFSLKNISFEEGFLLMSFFENFNFWTTLFSKMVSNFWQSVWTSVKVKSKNYFSFTDFLAKMKGVDSRPQNSTTEVMLFSLNNNIKIWDDFNRAASGFEFNELEFD